MWTASHNRLVQCWSVTDLSELKSFDGHLGVVNSLSFTESQIFAAGDDGTVRSWDKKTGVRGLVYKGHGSWVTKVFVEGNVLITTSNDHTARAWHISTGRCLQIYQHSAWVRTACMHGGNLWTASGSLLRCWNYKVGECIKTIDVVVNISTFLFLDETTLAVAGDDGKIYIWKGDTLVKELLGHSDSIAELLYFQNTLVSASYDHKILLWKDVA